MQSGRVHACICRLARDDNPAENTCPRFVNLFPPRTVALRGGGPSRATRGKHAFKLPATRFNDDKVIVMFLLLLPLAGTRNTAGPRAFQRAIRLPREFLVRFLGHPPSNPS